MNDFWKNIVRYPRFFISSVAGLIFVLVSPLRNLFKIKKFRIFLPIFVLFIIGLVVTILVSMTGA